MPIQVNLSRCPQNHPCPALRVCPAGALTQSGYNAPVVDPTKCTNCNKCIRYCPMGAFEVSKSS